MKTSILVILLSVTLFYHGPGVRADEGIPLECDGFRDNFELKECRGREIDISEYKLTIAYKALLAELDRQGTPELKIVLVKAQREWIKWREKEADWCSTAAGWPAGPGLGGSGTSIQVGFCWEALNERRTKELREYLTELRRGP